MSKTLLLLFLLASGCATSNKGFTLETHGEMRSVLRDGNTSGRVVLKDRVHRGTWGLGALAQLEGEITILDGEVFLEVVEEGALVRRPLADGDQAALLVLTSVPAWSAVPLRPVESLKDLEVALAEAIFARGLSSEHGPVPVRIEGTFRHVGLHVLDHSCPIANPEGPPPIRWKGALVTGSIVGIFAPGFGGKLTHHGQDTHLHVVLTDPTGASVSGHLEELRLDAGAHLFLPAGI
jgi:alpha-acetolactate decarboxylase